MSDNLVIAYRRIAELAPYKRNSRTHTAGQIRQLEASLAKFGWTNPILIAGNNVIAGHARLQAATNLRDRGGAIVRHADLALVPTIDLSALSAPERRAYVIADNKLAEAAGWDNELLRFELRGLEGDGFDLTLTGFSSPQLQVLRGLKGEAEAPRLSAGMQYQIVIECQGELHQAELLAELGAKGLKVRPLIL